MVIGIPQIIYFILQAVSLIAGFVFHGKPQKGKTSVWTTIIATLIAWWLYTAGGAFAVIGFPQYILFGLMAWGMLWAFTHNGEEKESIHNVRMDIVLITANAVLLYYCGFFGPLA